MRIKHPLPRSGPASRPARAARRLRAAALLAGLAAVFALTAPGAALADSERTYSASELKAASDAILAADVGGTAWTVDEDSGSVRVDVDSTVSASEIAALKKAAGPSSGALHIERTRGKLTQLLSGGDAIYSSNGFRCSAGFNTHIGTSYYILTAGHCTNGYPNWSARLGVPIGPTAYSSFPGNDYGYVSYTNPLVLHPSNVNLYNGTYRAITGTGSASVGLLVQRSGSTTGLHGGTVTGLNYTVNYGNGNIVYQMIRTNVCAEPGDSGGPLFSGNTAIGLTSGGSGNCALGGVTYYQPVVEALNNHGATIP
ncbi:S1 family peptidase [Streptomyces sp. ME19-01-6]|uniref:S1 family peptidase n=1 Tax=Streptomyces sp. ME19-01-6 TaxID=3028686 RepID=UPI0029A57498|nr:S1 family peptidase [Streptomyces sp. ME19-01-6]MDX3228087.1 S1 family peptidase [Streptomyces sp. ME19-01-6]